jgi:hypothetical protein
MRSDDDLGFITLTGIGHADLSWLMSVNFVNKTEACREVYLMTVRHLSPDLAAHESLCT